MNAVECVMAATGMEELQARRHLECRAAGLRILNERRAAELKQANKLFTEMEKKRENNRL